MRTLHVGLRVEDLKRSLGFYVTLGYEVVGTVPETEFGSLTMLKLTGGVFVSLELVRQQARCGALPVATSSIPQRARQGRLRPGPRHLRSHHGRPTPDHTTRPVHLRQCGRPIPASAWPAGTV